MKKRNGVVAASIVLLGLVVTLADHEKYQYFAPTPVDGVTVIMQQK